MSTDLGTLPEPVAWYRAPYGTLEPNPLFRVSEPQSLEWAVACYTEDQMRAYAAAEVARAVEAERHACAMEVWCTRLEATDESADDLGLDGWMREAERRIKARDKDQT